MSRALVVIDVQREYFEGAFPIRHPVGHLEAILEMMDAARRASIPTVVVRHHQPDPNSPVFRKGSEMWQLHDEVIGLAHQASGCGGHFFLRRIASMPMTPAIIRPKLAGSGTTDAGRMVTVPGLLENE